MRTLVADDDRIITAILSTTLTRLGMDVTVAHDGDVAWQTLNGLEPPAQGCRSRCRASAQPS
jgi:CheY-like chemotaxis protein